MNTKLAEARDINKLAQSLELAKDVITKDYLYQLSEYQVAELPDELKQIDISEYTRIYKFTRMVSDKKESVIDKFVTVLNAAYSSNTTVITLISGHKEYTDYYIGVVSKDISQKRENIETQGETLKGVLTGNFPGLEIVSVSGESKKRLLNNAFVYDYITSISGIASIRNEKDNSYEKYVQGIEHLVDSLQGKEYSVVVIADPVSAQDISATRLGYESLYTQLSPFLKTSISFNESESITLTQSHTDGVTESIGESTSLTQNYSKTSGWSESSVYGTGTNKETGHLVGSIIGAGVGVGVAATVLTGGAAAPMIAAAFTGSQIGSQIGGGVVGSSGKNTSRSTTETGSTTESSGTTTSKNRSNNIQNSDTSSEAEGTTHGKTMQFTNENKTVKNLLATIDKQIERLQKCESYGAFNCATYVISSDPETNAIVSSGYNALMRGDNSSLQASHINNWNVNHENGRLIKEYLMKFSHPLFISPLKDGILFSPASISNSYELTVNMGLPKKSINGLPVFEMASFGREPHSLLEEQFDIDLGCGYHMRKIIPEQRISLSKDELTKHTFITGSTGSGKSNTIYRLLERLGDEKVNFLVVEPAKGEYKDVMGKKKGVVTYGTNPNIKNIRMLRINPFRFPKNTHILEHLDRLVEIFNVCWPMYAAMPAILKDSVERAYVCAGWDLEKSVNKYDSNLFPTFADVVKQIKAVLDESDYSADNKGDYTGSLVTRLKSLTNGINGLIFTTDDITDEELFDQNAIVDLSRVGSTETKSLIMGLLVLKLQEHRMEQRATGSNANDTLKHVTVLEEAHNLLKRTSTEQSSEGANLLGKSVEMLANSIAEMRTYGEGFVIADQSPGLLDMSVIRNTNTKIILRLPDFSDRELVGKAAGLNDNQIIELSRLEQGVAAIIQSGWVEPVLCKIDEYKKDNDFNQEEKTEVSQHLRFNVENSLLECIMSREIYRRGDRIDLLKLKDAVIKSSLRAEIKCDFIRYIDSEGEDSVRKLQSLVYDFFDAGKAIDKAKQCDDIKVWAKSVVGNLNPDVREYSDQQINLLLALIVNEQIVRNAEYNDLYCKYTEVYRRDRRVY